MKKLWMVFIGIFVFSFAILGWVGTEIFRQAPALAKAASYSMFTSNVTASRDGWSS